MYCHIIDQQKSAITSDFNKKNRNLLKAELIHKRNTSPLSLLSYGRATSEL